MGHGYITKVGYGKLWATFRPLSVQRHMRKTAWIWLVGCIAWTVDGVVNVGLHATQHAELAFLMALLFGIAWLFYRGLRN